MPKILIAVPTFENIMTETFESIYRLKGPDTDFKAMKGYSVDVARNRICEMAKKDYDYVLMVDSDVIIPANTLEVFLDNPVDICLGLCPRKNTKLGETTIFKTGGFYSNDKDRYYYDSLPKKDRFEIKGGGAACIFIKTDVFNILPFPWFNYVTYGDGSRLSEDFYFCNQATRHGLRIYADKRIRCGHATRSFQYE